MEEKEIKKCLNCGAEFSGNFCNHCGQKAIENTDRSLFRLITEFFGNIFFLDNRFFISIRHLIGSPGKMTINYLDGRRKMYLSPVTLFLFFNLIYFVVNPLSDYSLSAYDQVTLQPYSKISMQMLRNKLQRDNIEFEEYKVIYQNASDNISKSIMILNVPIIALFLYLMTFKKRRFYFDSLIFSFHFFSFFMVSWVTGKVLDEALGIIPGYDNSTFNIIVFTLCTLLLPLTYALISFKRFINTNWLLGLLGSIGIFVGVAISQLIYRALMFLLTYWTT